MVSPAFSKYSFMDVISPGVSCFSVRSLLILKQISSLVLIHISLKMSFLQTYLPLSLTLAAQMDKKQPTQMLFRPTEQKECLGMRATEWYFQLRPVRFLLQPMPQNYTPYILMPSFGPRFNYSQQSVSYFMLPLTWQMISYELWLSMMPLSFQLDLQMPIIDYLVRLVILLEIEVKKIGLSNKDQLLSSSAYAFRTQRYSLHRVGDYIISARILLLICFCLLLLLFINTFLIIKAIKNMQIKPESIIKDILTTIKPKSKSDQLKEQIKIQQQKLAKLKNIINPQLLQKIREIEKQIKRMEIITIDEGGSAPIISNLSSKELSNEQSLNILKNITTKSYINKADNHPTATTSSTKPFSPTDHIQYLEQQAAPHVMQTQIYPFLNRYLHSKSSLLTKIIQLNPEKRHNNSLLVPHQRVMLKEHLDGIRRVNEELQNKSQLLQGELERDFVLVKNRWEESQRELIKLSQ